jgi:hypothetical protein
METKTKTKTKAHTGFRNGDLFCFNCGTSYKMNLPQPVTMAAALMTQFEKDHKGCKPTWKEPTTRGVKTEEENANWWAVNGEHGISSKTMFNRLIYGLNVRPLTNSYQGTPSDPDDFKRCYKLIQAVPQWKNRLGELKSLSPVWSKLVDNWDKLTEMYEQNVREDWKNYKKVGMYEFMKSLGC